MSFRTDSLGHYEWKFYQSCPSVGHINRSRKETQQSSKKTAVLDLSQHFQNNYIFSDHSRRTNAHWQWVFGLVLRRGPFKCYGTPRERGGCMTQRYGALQGGGDCYVTPVFILPDNFILPRRCALIQNGVPASQHYKFVSLCRCSSYLPKL